MLQPMLSEFAFDFPQQGSGPYRVLRGVSDRLVREAGRSMQEPELATKHRLQVILEQVRGTSFGRDNGLENVKSLEDFRSALPIRTHQEHLPWLDRVAAGEPRVLTNEPVQMLLETSGTTGRPKHLPVTATWARGVADAQRLWVLAMLRDHPEVAEGAALTIVSAAEHARSHGGVPIGANTGRMHLAQPWWVRRRFPVPYRVFELQDPDVRLYTLLRFALQADLRTITTANPSTLLLIARRLDEWKHPLSHDLRHGSLRAGPAENLASRERRRLEWRLRRRAVPRDWRLRSLWNLSCVNCWQGGPAAYFAARVRQMLGENVAMREVGITASEGYFAVPLGQDWHGGALWPLGHVMEFVGDDDAPRWAWELEVGEQVRMIVSTEAGLYRYDLRDTVEVIGHCGRSPVLRFVGKTGRYLNATGEKVTEAQVAGAVREACLRIRCSIRGFTARLVWQEVPYCVLAIEPEATVDVDRLAAAFDTELGVLNNEYASKRETSRLAPAVVERLPVGTYAAYRRARVHSGAPDGQVKDPVMALDAQEWTRIRDALKDAP